MQPARLLGDDLGPLGEITQLPARQYLDAATGQILTTDDRVSPDGFVHMDDCTIYPVAEGRDCSCGASRTIPGELAYAIGPSSNIEEVS